MFWRPTVVAAWLAGAVLVTPATAAALGLDTDGGLELPDPGTVTDTVDKAVQDAAPVLEDARKTVRDTATSVTDTDPGATIDKVVDDPVGAVQDIVDGVVDDVRDTTDAVTDPVDTIVDPLPDRDGTAGPVGPGGGSDKTESRGKGSQRRKATAAGPTRPGARARGNGRTAATPPAPRRIATAPVAATTPDAAGGDGSVVGRIADASRRFSLPLALILAVLLFLAVQGRLDRNAAKLTVDDDEELRFA